MSEMTPTASLTFDEKVNQSQQLLDDAIAEVTARPDEPSLPPGQWFAKNLFSSKTSAVFTLVFGLGAVLAYRGILNFVFSEERRWDSVRSNLRLLFTHAYPTENYTRVWLTVGVLAVLTGASLGIAKVGRGVSMKRLAMWAFGWGALITGGVFLRQPSVVKDSLGRTRFIDPDAVELGYDQDGLLTYPNGDRPDAETLDRIRESFGSMVGDRIGWLAIGLGLIAIGALIWFGLGDRRRRSTYAPAIPLGLGLVGLLASSTWWYKWGHRGRADGEFFSHNDKLVAASTRIPWTLIFVVMIACYLFGRLLKARELTWVRPALIGAWLLAPFVTFWGILRYPVMDWGHVVSTDIPLWLAFAIGGAAFLWALTRPNIGEIGPILATLVVLIAVFTWVGAFFGWFSMLQKVRFSLLLLGLTGYAASNFKGEARQRLKLVYGWLGLITIFHILVTIMNTPSDIHVATEEFTGGFIVTVYVAVFTMIFSFPLGVLLALARTSRLPIFRMMSTVYIEVVRGVPLITVLFLFTIMLDRFMPPGMDMSNLAAVTVGFTLFSGAYLAENVRGGLQAIRQGQYEASDALGLTTVQRTVFIVLPQALRVSIPPLVGQLIATFKETSLLAIVGVFDFLLIARGLIPNQTEFYGYFKEGFLFISAIYFVAAYAMSKYSQRLERQLGVGER